VGYQTGRFLPPARPDDFLAHWGLCIIHGDVFLSAPRANQDVCVCVAARTLYA
jgi:hypothetical protein